MLRPAQRGFFTSRDSQESRRRTPSYFNFFGLAVLVGQEYAVMLHRFEKFNRQLTPGLNIIFPMIDKVAFVHDLREQVIEVPGQMGVTKDNVSIQVDGVLYI